MYTKILLTTDGSELADKAIQHGISLAAKVGAAVSIITVIKPLHVIAPAEVMVAFPSAEYEKGAQENARSVLEKAESLAKQAGVASQSLSVTHEEPWQAIVDAADEGNCDLIVMGSHGRSGLTRLMLGSEAQKVLTHTKTPVLIVR